MAFTEEIKGKTLEMLMDLIRIPSTRGNEGPVMQYLHKALAPHVDGCDLIPVDDAIMQDPDYAFWLPGHSYADTPNLECIIRGEGAGPTIIFNTHVDVVPPSEGQERAFDPCLEGGIVYGRGACDAKGQVATLYALALLMEEQGFRPPGNVIFHFVFEEENGGNGTLAMIRRGVQGDAAIVLEPSDMAVVPAVRGAVWFQLKVFGRAGHSGSKGGTISALHKAIDGMQILEGYHDRLLAASRGHPLFDRFQDPMPLTFGMLQAGKWPASVPAEATLKGVLGFLPNKNRHQIQKEMREVLCREGDPWLREHFELTFPMLNSDGYSLPQDHPLVTCLRQALRKNGVPGEIRAMTASCDAWLYNNQAGIPTLVFGPGSLAHAHSAQEQIHLDDIMTAASALVDFIRTFSKGEKSNG